MKTRFHKIGNALIDPDDISAVVPRGDEYVVILKSGGTFVLNRDEAVELWELLYGRDDWRGG